MITSNKTLVYVLATIILVGVSFFVYIHFFKSDDIKNYPSLGQDVIAFGDSLVFGQGASDGGKNFVSLLSKRTGESIVNLGVSGNTTGQALSRLSDLDAYNPKVVLVLLGGNDYLQKVPIETTFQNLANIIKNIQRRGAVVVLLGVRGGLLNDRFDTEFEKLSKQYKTAYVSDVLDGLIADSRYMADAVHPNDIGYQKIADRIYPILQKFIK